MKPNLRFKPDTFATKQLLEDLKPLQEKFAHLVPVYLRIYLTMNKAKLSGSVEFEVGSITSDDVVNYSLDFKAYEKLRSAPLVKDGMSLREVEQAERAWLNNSLPFNSQAYIPLIASCAAYSDLVFYHYYLGYSPFFGYLLKVKNDASYEPTILLGFPKVWQENTF